MAHLHGFHHARVFTQAQADDGQQPAGLLHVAAGLGHDDEVALEPSPLEGLQGNRVAHAAVQQFVALEFDHARDDRHRGRGAHPVECHVTTLVAALVDGLARLHVGTHHPELGGILLESLVVEDIIFVGHHMVGILGAEQVARAQERLHAAIALVAGETLVVADGTPYLSRFVVAAESRSSRYPYHTVERDVVFQHHVHNTSGEQAPHGPSLKYESFFHCLFIYIFWFTSRRCRCLRYRSSQPPQSCRSRHSSKRGPSRGPWRRCASVHLSARRDSGVLSPIARRRGSR